MISFSDAVKTCLTEKYASISGRATRAEYWWFQLFVWSVCILIILIGNSIGGDATVISCLISGLFIFATLVPNFCSRVRRLHDAGYSGLTLLFCLIPYVGALIVFIIELRGSDDDNDYGPNPFSKQNKISSLDATKKTHGSNDHEDVVDVEL